MDPVASQVGGYVVFEQFWNQVRHGVFVVGWVVLLGLVTAASCWCCGYVVHSDLSRSMPPVRRRQSRQPLPVASGDDLLGLTDDEIAEEAARGIREIERYLSTA